ncbi:MAG: ABC transporter ATP-binding protein [Spartobacteria bacterium]|nr:ABC transporter ATP-binding protein [Spartobacteria bacterium]
MTVPYEIDHLVKRYDNGVLAVDDLHLSVQKQEIFCMLGANGAGKTTTLMVSLGFTPPSGGTVRISGYDITREPLEAKAHVAYVSENVQLYGNFTAMQNIRFFSELSSRGKMEDAALHEVLARVGLGADAHKRRVRGFSKGMRQRLGIAIAIIRDADLILLDEPTSGLDPKGGLDFMNLLQELRREGRAVFMTTHDIFRAREIADRIGIMVRGKLVRVLETDEIEHADLAAIYTHYIDQMAIQEGGARPDTTALQ